MDSDLDPFADVLPEQTVNNVRVAGKFQPRAKLRPGKATSTSLPENAKESSRSSLQNPPDVVDDRLISTSGLSVASSTLTEKEEISENNRENTKSEPVSSSTQVARVVDLNSSDALSLEDESLQLDLQSFVVPDSSLTVDNRPKEPTSSTLGMLSVAKEHGNDNDGLCLHELDSVNAVSLENRASDGNGGWSSSFMKSTEDVGSLGLELDPFADAVFLPAADNARVGGKFKPKVKVQRRKGATAETGVPIPSGRMEELATVDTVVSENPVYPSVTTSENLVTEGSLENEDYTTSGVILSTDPHSSLEKPIGENADIYLGLEYFHDIVTQSPNNIEIPVPTSNVEETERQCSFPTQNSGYSSVLKACHESVDRKDDGRLSEESGRFFNGERPEFFPDPATEYESRSRKFQPKPQVQNLQEKTTVTNFALPTDSQFITSETGYGSEGVLDYSSMSFCNFIPSDTRTAEAPMDEEQANFAEASQSVDANIFCQEDGVPENKSLRSKKQKASAVSNPPHKSKAGKGNEGDKSSRHLRKKIASPQIFEEPEDETHDNDNIPSEAPGTSVADDDNDYDYRLDEDNRSDITSQKKRSSKKSEIPAAKKQNPGRRCKRESDAQECPTQVPQKKRFSHSTRRRNRLKELLSIPEDEVDFQRLPFKDIIMLAGHKESLTVKEAKSSKNALNDQSSKNSANGEKSLNEEDTSEQDGGYVEDQSNLLFNHNSFMDKTPRSRWSKQETELFYEGISQFGTDLSMIQQLFPGKTRHQMKLKYKKEERQNPLRLHEALSSRSKDNSYFEKVIEQLKHVAAQAEQESNKDGSAGASDDEEADLNPETCEDTEKMEHDEDIIAEDREEDVAIQSPKYDEDEDDMDVYTSYETIY